MKARIGASALALSAAALVGIAVHEGYIPQAYLDAVGVQTIGFGTTGGVKPGDKTDPVRALIRLNADADRMQAELHICIGDVPMYQHEWDAVVSWTYNVGTGAACGSTLVRKLKAGDYAGACAELDRWVMAGGRVLPGLVKRRAAERSLCEGKPYATLS